MLTPSDRKNIKNFKFLDVNHQRVFKHRLIKKCESSINDIIYILVSYENMPFKLDKLLDVEKIVEILELYENLSKLQNM